MRVSPFTLSQRGPRRRGDRRSRNARASTRVDLLYIGTHAGAVLIREEIERTGCRGGCSCSLRSSSVAWRLCLADWTVTCLQLRCGDKFHSHFNAFRLIVIRECTYVYVWWYRYEWFYTRSVASSWKKKVRYCSVWYPIRRRKPKPVSRIEYSKQGSNNRGLETNIISLVLFRGFKNLFLPLLDQSSFLNGTRVSF